jgi:hypothetical protein
MPCDTISTARVVLGPETNRGLLDNALRELGFPDYNVVTLKDGTLRVDVTGAYTGPEFTAKVKRAYSKQVVLSQAKRFGWQVKEQPNGKLLVQKASF